MCPGITKLGHLRYTYASHYMMNGGTLDDLQGLLDHSDRMMTQRYAHLAPGYLETKAGVVTFGQKRTEANVLSLTATYRSKRPVPKTE